MKGPDRQAARPASCSEFSFGLLVSGTGPPVTPPRRPTAIGCVWPIQIAPAPDGVGEAVHWADLAPALGRRRRLIVLSRQSLSYHPT